MTKVLDHRPLNCTCGWWTEYNNDGEWGGLVTAPDPTCLARPHPERFLTPRHRTAKVEPMTKTTVYCSTPDIYEADLRQLVDLMDGLEEANDRTNDLYVETVTVCNSNGYTVGTLTLEDDFWKFTPFNESDVEADIDVI